MATLMGRILAQWALGAPRPELSFPVTPLNPIPLHRFNQIGARVALTVEDDGLTAANEEWQRRRDETLRQLDGLPAVRPAGAWSLLLDVAALGLDCMNVSNRLLEQKVAATPMRGWGGDVADRHVRFVFSNEPVERLATLGERVHAALA